MRAIYDVQSVNKFKPWGLRKFDLPVSGRWIFGDRVFLSDPCVCHVNGSVTMWTQTPVGLLTQK